MIIFRKKDLDIISLYSVGMKKTEDMVQYKKEYYIAHKQIILEKMMNELTCECGFKCASCNLKRHQKTKLHLKKLNKL